MNRADRTWLTPAETQPGPSVWTVCTRPSCGLVFRRLSFIAPAEPVCCPMCGDRVTAARGRRLTRLLHRAMVISAQWARGVTVVPSDDVRRAA